LNHNLFAERTLTWEIPLNYPGVDNDNVPFVYLILCIKIAALQNGNREVRK
jgi:hypothetical protein